MKRRMFRTLGLVALLPALAAGPLAAQKQAPPEPGPAKNFTVPTPRKFTLDNGLAVTLVPYGTVPKVTVRLGVRTGNIDEAANEIWLSDIVGDYLTQGTATRSATQIAETAARMGGSLDVTVGLDRTDVGGDVLSESAAEMIGLVADVVRNATFRPPSSRVSSPTASGSSRSRRASPSRSLRRSFSPRSTEIIRMAASSPPPRWCRPSRWIR